MLSKYTILSGYTKVSSMSPLHQSLPGVNKLRSTSLPGTTMSNDLPMTSLSGGLLRNNKSVDRPRLDPLKHFGFNAQNQSSASREATKNNVNETKRTKRFSTDQKSFFAMNRKMSVERQRLLAVLTRNSTKCTK